MYIPATSTKLATATTKQPIATPKPVAPQTSPLLKTSQPLTQTTSVYKDPRAGILYGSGNSGISDADIKHYIGTVAKTPEQILDAALQYGVSADQITRAMNSEHGFDAGNVSNYLNSQGISREMTRVDGLTPPKSVPLPDKVVAPVVQATPVQLNDKTDMVEGRLDNLLSNPNNPLMQRSQAMAAQSANRRGLLNSSIGVGAGQAAMIDAGLQIATPDAQARVGAAMQNAEQSNRVNMQNAQNSLTAGMFNADLQAKLGMFDGEMNFKAGAFNAEQVNGVIGKYLDNDNRVELANIEAKYQRDLQGSANSAKLFSDVMQLATQISTSDLPADAKQGNINNLFKMLDMGLSMNNSFAGLGLDKAFTSSGEQTGSGSILKQLSGGQIDPSQAPAPSESAPQAAANSSGTVRSTITGMPLGESKGNSSVFYTIGGPIPKGAADAIKKIYGDAIDPRFIITEDQIYELAYTSQHQGPNAPLYTKLGMDKVQLIRQGQRLQLRDPKYGVAYDKALEPFSNGVAYYDPQNLSGLAG